MVHKSALYLGALLACLTLQTIHPAADGSAKPTTRGRFTEHHSSNSGGDGSDGGDNDNDNDQRVQYFKNPDGITYEARIMPMPPIRIPRKPPKRRTSLLTSIEEETHHHSLATLAKKTADTTPADTYHPTTHTAATQIQRIRRGSVPTIIITPIDEPHSPPVPDQPNLARRFITAALPRIKKRRHSLPIPLIIVTPPQDKPQRPRRNSEPCDLMTTHAPD